MQFHDARLIRYAVRLVLPLASLAGCSVAASDLPDANVKSTEQEIINGTIPARGALRGLGVVELSTGCTGILLTNRHVLTAHHCVRAYNGSGAWAMKPESGVRVRLEGPIDDQWATQSKLFEPPLPWFVNAGDYSIIELDAPMEFEGRTDAFFNRIYSQADSTLEGQSVFCVGYGGTAEATTTQQASGFGTLTFANLRITSVGTNTYTRMRQNVSGVDVVGFRGDSGGTCFLNGEITGVASTCVAKWVDADRDLYDDGWFERYETAECTSASADSIRTWVRQQVMADATITYDFVPALPTTPTLSVVITTAERSSTAEVIGNWTGMGIAPRATRMDVRVTSEPAFMMCPTVSTSAPLEGAASVRTTCLSDALLPVILG